MQKINPNSPAYKTIVRGVVKGHEHIKSKRPDCKDFFKTTVVVPAPDTLSHPKTYSVNASAPLGTDESEVAVICDVRSYTRNGYHNATLWLDESREESAEN